MNIKRHWNYLKYVMRHKWFVILASYKINASLWLALIHDLSKFLPSEWFPYAETFYTPDGKSQYNENLNFQRAWLVHQHRNPHHWQYWLLRLDRGNVMATEMPEKYVYEMVADWMGAGKAISGKWEYIEWYEKNKNRIKLHHNTRLLVENIIYGKDN